MNYFALITRTDFNYLFNYGEMLFNCDFTIDNSDSLKEKMRDKACFIDSFSHLIIEYEKKDTISTNNCITIQEIRHVYPLDCEAKRDFESSFDSRIKIDDPLFDISDILKHKAFENCKRGIDNVWQIFGFSDDKKELYSKIITDEIIKKAVKQLFTDKPIEGDYPLWVYLMRYERHSYYPKNTIGYFMDVVHIFCNYTKKTQIDDTQVEQTHIYRILETIPDDKKMDEICDNLEKTESVSPFLSKLSETDHNCNFLKVAVIYLLNRDKFVDGLKYDDKDYIDKCKDCYGENFTIASYLLGIYLGYDKTYNCLYDHLSLSFFKSPDEMAKLKREQEAAKIIAQEKMNEPPVYQSRNNTLFGSQETYKSKTRTRKSKKNGK